MNGTLIGRLGADPETKSVGQSTVTECRVAKTIKGKDGDTTAWYRAAIWGARGEAFARYHSKGDLVILHGELQPREYVSRVGKQGLSLDLRVHGWDFAGNPRKDVGGGSSAGRRDESDIPFAQVEDPTNG